MDFISTHSYGVKQGFLDEFGNSGTVLSKDSMAVSGDVLNTRKQYQTLPCRTWNCIIPNGAHRTLLPIQFTTVIMKPHTY